MITSALLYAIYGLVFVITSPLRLLDDVILDNNFVSSIQVANGYLASLNSFIPMDTIVQILVVYLIIEGSVLVYKLIMWLIKRIPTQS